MEIFDPQSNYLTTRFKLFWVDCKSKGINSVLEEANGLQIPCIDIGKKLSSFLNKYEGSKFLSLDTEEELKRLISQESKRFNSSNSLIAIYNLGILLEPTLKIDAVKIIKELSKEVLIIILWDALVIEPAYFFWSKENEDLGLNFSDTNINKISLQYEV